MATQPAAVFDSTSDSDAADTYGVTLALSVGSPGQTLAAPNGQEVALPGYPVGSTYLVTDLGSNPHSMGCSAQRPARRSLPDDP